MLELIEITPTLSLVPGENDGRFPRSNSLLVRDGGLTTLIDTGCGHDVIRALLAEYTIDMVICTHTHIDHTSGNWLLAGRPIWSPAASFDTRGEKEILAKLFFADPAIGKLWIEQVLPFAEYEDAPPTDAYKPGHVFRIGNTELHAIHAPGHVHDHFCFWEPESRTLLATDIDFTGFGPWYGNPTSDPQVFKESIQKVWAMNPHTVISSHKGLFRDGLDAHFQSYLEHFERRDRLILEAIREPQTLAALEDQAIIYGHFPILEPLLRYFEREMVRMHLEGLAKQELAKEVAPGRWQRV